MIGGGNKGLATPTEYADFVEECLERGYFTYELHTLFLLYAQD